MIPSTSGGEMDDKNYSVLAALCLLPSADPSKMVGQQEDLIFLLCTFN